jgi:hypothetical protein
LRKINMTEKRNRQEIAIEKEKKKTVCVQQGLLGSQVHLLAGPSPTACPSSKLAMSLANEYGPIAKTVSLLL